MSVKYKIFTGIIIGISILFVDVPAVLSATVNEIAQSLACPCGCSMLVSACEGTMECATASDIKNQIVTLLDEDNTTEEVLAYFVAGYGEQILSSPTKRGFNLTAWILPFAAVFFGSGALYGVLKKWNTPTGKPETEQVSFKQEDQAYLKRIEKELRTFE